MSICHVLNGQNLTLAYLGPALFTPVKLIIMSPYLHKPRICLYLFISHLLSPLKFSHCTGVWHKSHLFHETISTGPTHKSTSYSTFCEDNAPCTYYMLFVCVSTTFPLYDLWEVIFPSCASVSLSIKLIIFILSS